MTSSGLKAWAQSLKTFFTGEDAETKQTAPASSEQDGNEGPLTSENLRGKFILISVIGMKETARDQMLDWMVDDCRAKGKTPVFITDNLDLSPWIERQLLVEHLPSLERQTRLAPDLDWDLYLNRRLTQIMRKWQTADITDLGQKLDRIRQLLPARQMEKQDDIVEPIGHRG